MPSWPKSVYRTKQKVPTAANPMDMPATASCTAWRPYCSWLEMQMIEPITGKVEKMPDHLLPMKLENWVITTVMAAPVIMRAGKPHHTCSRSSSEASPRGYTNQAPTKAAKGHTSRQREA